MYLQSWTYVLGHFCISGVFSNSHRPDPSPHPTNNVWRVYPELFPSFNLYRVGKGELCKILKKMHYLMREPRTTQKYVYCNTVPRTFVHDCSLELGICFNCHKFTVFLIWRNLKTKMFSTLRKAMKCMSSQWTTLFNNLFTFYSRQLLWKGLTVYTF